MKKVALIFAILVIICHNVIVPAVCQQAAPTKQVCCSVKHQADKEAAEPAAEVFFPSLLIMD